MRGEEPDALADLERQANFSAMRALAQVQGVEQNGAAMLEWGRKAVISVTSMLKLFRHH
jgi:hypothetical protein